MGYVQADPDRAIKNMKDVMTAMKYLQDPTIKSRLIAEKERIAARLKELDEVRMPAFVKVTRTGAIFSKWVSIGLEDYWNRFMRESATTAKDRAVKHIDEYLAVMKEVYVSQTNRDFARQPGNENQALAALLGKIDALDAEWARYKPISWTNPF